MGTKRGSSAATEGDSRAESQADVSSTQDSATNMNYRKSSKRTKSSNEQEEEEEEEEEDLEEQEAAAERNIRIDRRALNGSGGQCGIIYKIYCEHFMCHRKLSVTLGKNVNFINGANGSGKSAILAALQICLGAKANTTHRAKSLGSLVRHGYEGMATVRVTLRNEGQDAYLPDVYPKFITIERKIDRNRGGQGYRILKGNPDVDEKVNPEEGLKVVGRDKKEIDKILDRFNIQVQNPVAVLDQENAKKFLRGSAKEKYAFFMKATNLESIDRVASRTKDKLTEMEAQIADAQKALPGYKEIGSTLLKNGSYPSKNMPSPLTKNKKEMAKEEQKKYLALAALEKDEADLKLLNCKIAWAMVQESKEELEREVLILSDKQKELDEKEAEVQLARENYENFSQSDDKDNTKISDLNRHITICNAELEAVRREISAINKRIKDLQIKSREEEKSITYLKNTRKKKQDEINYIRTEASEKLANEERQRIERIKNLERKIEDIEVVYKESMAVEQELEPKVRAFQQDLQQLNSEVATSRNRLRQTDDELRNLKQSQGSDDPSRFGKHVSSILKEIEKYRREFRDFPVGPVGAYIKMKEEHKDAAQTVENSIAALFGAFVVYSREDLHLFNKIKEKVDSHAFFPVYLVKKNNRYNVNRLPNVACRIASSKPETQGIISMSDCINVENDTIFNLLVDEAKIDLNAVVVDRREAESLLRNSQGSLFLPQGVGNVYFKTSPDMMIVKGGTVTIRSVGTGAPRRLGVDLSDQLKAYQEQMEKINRDMKDLERQKNDIQSVHSQTARQCQDAQKKRIDAEKKKRNWGDELSEARSLQKQEVSSIDTSLLEQDVDRLADEIGDLEDSLVKVIDEIERQKQDLTPLDTKRIHLGEKSAVLKEESVEVERRMEKSLNEAVHLKEIVNEKSNLVEKVKVHIEKCQGRVGEQRELYNDQVNQATTYTRSTLRDEWDGEPMLSNTSVKGLQKDKEKARLRLQRAQEERNTNDTPELAKARFKAALAVYDIKKSEIKSVKETHDLILESIQERKKRWLKFREHISRKTANQFDMYLNKKGQSGSVYFDQDKEELGIKWQKDNNDEGTQLENVKSLSGGERSYATLSLLLSLGDSIESPFRVMDEFDIYMDAVSRKAAISALLDVGKINSHRQFIFITPQDLTQVKENRNPNVRIIKMLPPERSQANGRNSQTTLN